MLTMVVHVEKKRDALARIVILFHRLAFNIESLTMHRAANPGILRITMTIAAEPSLWPRIEAQLHKLVDALVVENITETDL